MSRRWIQNPNRCTDEYLDEIEDFIDFARTHNPSATRIRCPYRRCNNTLWETIENVQFYLVRNGMIETYSTWTYHGEQLDIASSSRATSVENVEPIVDPNEQVMDILNDAFPFASTSSNQGEKMTCLHQWTVQSLNRVFKRMLPTDNCLPKDHRQAQKVLNGLGLGYEKIHACKNNCMLFYKEYETLDTCPICNKSRFKTSQNRMAKIPQKEKRVDDDVMRHPVAREAWKEFPEFAADTRNVRLRLATDGFNP
ncbi:unnamed protein product [Prunus armeniaca]